jgi:hypothetical protein
MPTPQEEVTRAWAATIAVEAAPFAVVHAVEASAQEVVAVWESTVALVKDVEDRAAQVEREAQEMVWRVEAKSVTMLDSACGEVDVFTRRISLLDGELAEVC